MIRLIQRRLIIPRGDTGSFSLPVLANTNTGDIAVFTIFDGMTKTRMYQKIVEIEGDVLNIVFSHNDTVNLKPGKYFWDIKFYSNPQFVEDELVNGDEVDSYYAGFTMPACEIRETADNYLVSPDSPTATLSPEQLDIITGAISELNEAIRKTDENVEHYPEIRNEIWYVWDTEVGDFVSTGVRANGIVGNGIASAVLNDDYTLTLNFTDGTSYTSPSIRGETGNGINDIVLNNDFTLTISYTDGESYTTPSIRGPVGATPQFSIGTVQEGPNAAASITGTAENPVLNLTLSNADVPTRVSELENDAGYLTEHQDLSDYVQKTDYATSSDAGVVKVDGRGLAMSTAGIIQVMSAPSSKIKIADDNYYFPSVKKQHESTFYGLAKAAGDSTQSVSSNAVGTYTNEAKAAIQTMLDVPSNADVAAKQDTLTFDSAPTANSTNPVTSGGVYSAITNINTMKIHICAQGEYNSETGVPTIQNPDTQTFYLVPGGEGSNLFIEWAYVNSAWERFGSADVDLSNYVQKTDIASSSETGVVRVTGSGSGIAIDQFGALKTYPAQSETIQIANNTNASKYQPITPNKQHESVFYGLAKAAGDSTQSASSNAIGTYTDEAKAAIQQMLDVPSTDDIPEVPVTDVQIDGTSILNNGVANVPIASASSPGVIFAGTGVVYGITRNSSNFLQIAPAAGTEIKAGINGLKPIVPSNQHSSAFYGLAKAAGADMASITNTTVGTYPDAQKEAIQSMLGISQMLAPENPNLVASQAYAIGDVFAANGKLYKATAAIAQDEAIIPDTNCVETTMVDESVRDVQIAGTSVVGNDGVANVPIAGATDTLGLVKVNTSYGLNVYQNGLIRIWEANSADIKGGTHQAKPIAPDRQHESTFYGLAKAAGADEKNSTLPVGQYTDTAKAAIKNMLGITQTLTVTALTQDGVTVTGQIVTVRADSSEGEVYATAAYEGQPVSFALPTGFQFYVSVSDTLDHHFNPTTAKGIITDTNVAVTLTYSDFSTIRTAPDIKAALNAGMDLTDLVGEQITCTKGSDTLTWDVVDYDATNKSIKLLLHDCFGTANMVFEPAQALMWCENGLAAGAYTFKNSTTSYYFTLTQAIPAGGQLVASDDGTFKTYESQSAMATLEIGTVSTTEIAGATDLGTTATGLLNHNSRVRYGSNNYAESALLWWLNTDAPAGTLREPITKFSRAYSYNVPGFLYNLDADFIACLDDVEWLCSTNNTYECPKELGGYTNGIRQAYTITKKIGLASEMEIFGSYGGTSDGSTVFDLYNDATADDRKKYRGTSAQVWWLRSPYWHYAYGERAVSSSGGAYNVNASNSYAVVPACQISKTAE